MGYISIWLAVGDWMMNPPPLVGTQAWPLASRGAPVAAAAPPLATMKGKGLGAYVMVCMPGFPTADPLLWRDSGLRVLS